MTKTEIIEKEYMHLTPKFKKAVQEACVNEFHMTKSSVRTNWFSRFEIPCGDDDVNHNKIIGYIQIARTEQERQNIKLLAKI